MKDQLLEILKQRPLVGIPRWMKVSEPKLFEQIQLETVIYSPKNFMEQLYIVLNGEPPKCKCNNYRVFNTYNLGYRIGCKLGNKCLDVSENRVQKQKITLFENFGVSNVAQLDTTKEKIKQTNLQKYGVEHHSQNTLVKQKSNNTRKLRTNDQKQKTKEKAINTTIKKYGVQHHMNLKSQQEKVKNTNLLKYQVEFPLQNIHSLDKMKQTWKKNDIKQINSNRKQTLIEKYGVDAVSKIDLPQHTINVLSSENLFCSFVQDKERKIVIDELKIHEHTLYLYAKKYNARHLFKRPLISKFETEVAMFLTDLKVEYYQNDRNIIVPQELDFFIPKHNVAIECSGLYWHSENSAGRGRNYHYNKFNKCKELGISLITIFEDEWQSETDKIKNRIRTILEKNNDKIYARKTKVQEIDTKLAKNFIDNYHIQSYAPAKISLGIFYEGELLSVMTFNKPRYNKKYEYEIIRYCSSRNVIGGASKLLNFFVEKHSPKSIVSYNDNRYFNGNVYKNLGFTQTKTVIGYFYTNYKKRFDRLNFQKHKLVEQGYDKNKSEWQIMQDLGFDRIWDCGQTSWVLNFDK
jgi:hypothetical protein